MVKLSRKQILVEKASGNYSCPHFVPPAVASEIAASLEIQLSDEAAKALAEISENFALELLRNCGSTSPTAEGIRTAVAASALT